MNFWKILFYYSKNTNKYFLIASAVDQRYKSFDTNSGHIIMETKNEEKFSIKSEEREIISIGKAIEHATAKNSVLFRFNIIIDNSGSIGKKHREMMESALSKFMRDFPPVFEAQIIKFSDNIQIRSGFLRDKQKLIRYINKRKPQGSCALYDVIHFGVQELLKYNDGIPFRFSIVLTSGKDTASKKSSDDLRLYTIPQCDENFIIHYILLATDDCGSVPLPEFMDANLFLCVDKFLDYDHNLAERIEALLKGLKKPGDSLSSDSKQNITESQENKEPLNVKSLNYFEIDEMLMFFSAFLKNTYIIKIPAIVRSEDIKTIYLVKRTKDGHIETIQDFNIN
jgi:hypothetical protein